MNGKSKQKIAKWLAIKNSNKSKQEFLNKMANIKNELQNDNEFIEKLKRYSALGNEIRYTIIKLLEQIPLCTCVLAEILEIKESSVSYHLKILEEAGIIIGLKSGSFINYHIKKQILREVD